MISLVMLVKLLVLGGISANVDKLIIDACEKMHKMKFGERHIQENISNKPISLDDLKQLRREL